MRILLYLALGIAALGALGYGLRLMWQAAFPQVEVEKGELVPSWIERREGKIFLALLGILFLLMAIAHLTEADQPLPAQYTPPHMKDGQIVPGTFR